jgi:signal transduction histidine kinase
MPFERHHSALIVSSVVTVASFVAATAYTQNRLARLDTLSSSIETNAVPSIEYLSGAAVRLTRLNQLLDDISVNAEAGTARTAAREEIVAVEADITPYLSLPLLPGETNLGAKLRDEVSRAVRLARLTIDGQPGFSGTPTHAEVDGALDRAVRSVLATLQYDVRQSETMARDVRQVRANILRVIVELDALATLVALGAVIVAYRASRRHDRLLFEHASLLDARVTELDRFAGRVAHDVLSPLGTVAAGLSLLERSGEEHNKTYIDRSQRALKRVQQLVDGLLTFARSGARPDPGSTCALDAVIASVVAECRETVSGKQIELTAETSGLLHVACDVGVMTSIVQNLIQNAIKYMGSRPVQRIAVRATAAGSAIRLEVQDSGPGIPLELQTAIFEPFVRGPHETTSGTGLGLATVRRLVESHGGKIGLQSTPGTGSLFWVELRAASVNAETAAAS